MSYAGFLWFNQALIEFILIQNLIGANFDELIKAIADHDRRFLWFNQTLIDIFLIHN